MTLTITLALVSGCLKLSKDDSSSNITTTDNPLVLAKHKKVLNLLRTRNINLGSLKTKYPSMEYIYVHDENKRNGFNLSVNEIHDDSIYPIIMSKKNMKITAKIITKDGSIIYERL
mgnify:FL=1|jgi:hypothetical protein